MPGAMKMVGPVLIKGAVAEAVWAAIERLNQGVEVSDRGAYLRISAPDRCVLTSEAVAAVLGRAFHLPVDLEAVMCSFSGELSLSHDRAIWYAKDATG
jgi:hypothetical protein